MNKFSEKIVGSGAIAALILVGGGLTPSHADWVASTNPGVGSSLSVPAISAAVGMIGDFNSYQTEQATCTGVASATFEWHPEANKPFPHDTIIVRHKMSITAPTLQAQLDANTEGPSSASATVSMNSKTHRSEYEEYDYRVNPGVIKHTSSPTGNPVFPNEIWQHITYYYAFNDNGTMAQIISPSWSPSLESVAHVGTYRQGVYNGVVYNAGGGTASVGAISAQTETIEIQ